MKQKLGDNVVNDLRAHTVTEAAISVSPYRYRLGMPMQHAHFQCSIQQVLNVQGQSKSSPLGIFADFAETA